VPQLRSDYDDHALFALGTIGGPAPAVQKRLRALGALERLGTNLASSKKSDTSE
jgi:hypothetical protein